MTNSNAYNREYLKDWRKRNPHYHKLWMRRKRNGGIDFCHSKENQAKWMAKWRKNNCGPDWSKIFDVRVRCNLMEWLCRPLSY